MFFIYFFEPFRPTDVSTYHTPMGPTSAASSSASSVSGRTPRPDFLDLSSSLVKKQRFMFTPPTERPPTSFVEERQSGDGRPAPVDAADAAESLLPHADADHLTPLDDDDDGGDVDDADATMTDGEFVSFHSPSIMERYAPQVDPFGGNFFVKKKQKKTLESTSNSLRSTQGLSDRDLSLKFPSTTSTSTSVANGKEGLVKWKGIVLTPDDEFAEEAHLGLVRSVYFFFFIIFF